MNDSDHKEKKNIIYDLYKAHGRSRLERTEKIINMTGPVFATSFDPPRQGNLSVLPKFREDIYN